MHQRVYYLCMSETGREDVEEKLVPRDRIRVRKPRQRYQPSVINGPMVPRNPFRRAIIVLT
jgi:hypothetical protein